MPRWLYFLLIFAVLAVVLEYVPFIHIPSWMLFVIAALGIVPLAALIGQSVEEVAEHTGERIGGLLFATFGNATELIIGIISLTKGLVDVVSATIIGTVLGNLLLVFGVAVCVGGFKNGRLRFETRPASQYASLLALSIGGLLLPTIAEIFATRANQSMVAERGVMLSDAIAVMLLIGYVASILFSVFRLGDKPQENEVEIDPLVGARSAAAIMRLLAYRQHLAQSQVAGKSGVLRRIDGTVDAIVAHETGKAAGATGAVAEQDKAQDGTGVVAEQSNASGATNGKNASKSHLLESSLTLKRNQAQPATEEKKPDEETKQVPLWRSLLLLILATVGVAIISEILVGTIEPMTAVLHWNAAFVGLIFIPLIGGLPEYFNTISMALDKRMEMVLSASAGSSIQIALLMAPILVLVSLFMPHRLDLIFSLVELAVLALATFLFSEVTKDGELVWLEGLLMILLYAMMGGTIFLFGNSPVIPG
ncbi:calcium:proton antiporter [Dictyobacter aurantiacus]|uniref:Sodium/calcium exchanger membrane region domain-containing protein n=1 Tax=Dictyobacter aurantiacus TaxID=1936993 RepID=A0A401ZAX7_9CHLR|nr:hypothetical protein [Dictyobacter aurantiacus]GCE04027.1 hypothetical protein KDAU_13560 [Dictyobacter aurantiacus]